MHNVFLRDYFHQLAQLRWDHTVVDKLPHVMIRQQSITDKGQVMLIDFV